jgi:ribosomal peptide maturation radical SAM protein 1
MTKQKKEPKKILLVSMPFPTIIPPSPQLSALDAYLTENQIPVESRHLYLRCADHMGAELYNALSAESHLLKDLIYSKFLFPQNFENNEHLIKLTVKDNQNFFEKVTLESIIEKISIFNADIMENVNWGDYDLVGFTTNFNQLLSSLFVAKEIKSKYPAVETVLGGFAVSSGRGESVMKLFPYVDYVIDGEGEKPLAQLAKCADRSSLKDIHGLMYRNNGAIVINKHGEHLDINTLPFYRLDSYFEELNGCSENIRLTCETNMMIPIENSRGCWWNKCNFCNFVSYHMNYREKNKDRVIDEIMFQSDKYKTLALYFIDETLRVKDVGDFFDSITDLGKDFMITAIGRANKLTKKDINKIYIAGVTDYQIGVESFSTSLLKKMCKGTTAIENIEIIKHCEETGITPQYSLMHSFPTQTKQDYDETARNLEYLESLPPPANIFEFQLQFGSNIYKDPKKFAIKKFYPNMVERLMYPIDVFENIAHGFYLFELEPGRKPYHEELKMAVEKWAEKCRAIRERTGGKSPLVYNDGGDFLIIWDIREKNQKKYILTPEERALYLFCDTARSLDEILEEFKELPRERVLEMLGQFDAFKLMFSEDNRYLSLAIRYRSRMNSEH